jgi:hypothetical protein
MGRKLFLIGCYYDVFSGMTHCLQNEHGWELQYWTADKAQEKEIREEFPGAVFHSVIDAARLIPAPELKDFKPYPVGQSLLRELADQESLVLWQMERMGSGPRFTFAERSLVYHQYLEYWGRVLSEFKPDVVIFPTAPHLVYDYVLYILCHKWSIKTVMFDSPSIYPELLFLLEEFEKGSREVANRYEEALAAYDGGTVELSPQAQKYFDNAQRDYNEGVPEHVKKLVAKAQASAAGDNWKAKLSYLLIPCRMVRTLKEAYQSMNKDALPNYMKTSGVSLQNSHMTDWEWRRDRERRRRTYEKMNAYYNEVAARVPLDVPYVYVALHFQPERTTSPLGGIFVDQLLMVDLLRAALPEDWWIFVKEAPTHFWPNVTKQVCRSKEFYDHILSKPKTKLVSMEMDQFSLIDNAKAVATITGTSAWEAVIRGVPALSFGYAWYRGCYGVLSIQDGEDVKSAVEAINHGFRPELAKVKLFNYVIEEVGINAYIESRYRDRVDITYEDNIGRLTEAVLKAVDH